MFSRRTMTKLPSNFLIYTEKPTQYVRALFNLTQPVWVATGKTRYLGECTEFQSNATRAGCNPVRHSSNPTHCHFNLTQPVRVATANLHKRSNKLSCILYNACLLFLTIRNSQTLSTIAISYPFYIILGAKRPAKLCSLIIRTCSKQKIPSPHNKMAVC